jgi:hypothetical protein
LPHSRLEDGSGVALKTERVLLPAWNFRRQRPCLRFEQSDQRLDEKRSRLVQLTAPGGFDLVDDIVPVDLVADFLPCRDAPQQRGLTFRPCQNIGLILARPWVLSWLRFGEKIRLTTIRFQCSAFGRAPGIAVGFEADTRRFIPAGVANDKLPRPVGIGR